jgi:hypothetical protein
MQNFKALAQPLLGEFGWGSLLFFLFLLFGKTKSTPRFALGWEFDKKMYHKGSEEIEGII